MFGIVGTVPDEAFPLTWGEVCLRDDDLLIQKERVVINRGTPALLAAAIKTAEVLNLPMPVGFLVGDIGRGNGSRLLYGHLEQHLRQFRFKAITFHYLQPDVDWHNRVLFALGDMSPRPVLIADAGFMYAAKMSGQANAYDLFTPDAGELAFLADEEAPHPFYTRGFVLHEENRIPELIDRAHTHENAAKYLLVKGHTDYVVCQQTILETIDFPSAAPMEAIGGTGDTLTGITSALIASGMDIGKAAVIAAKVNRVAGFHTRPTPATSVTKIIHQIPRALNEIGIKP